MAAPAQQQTQQQPSAAPKTRLGLSLAERIKVIEARQMGKSMRQVVYYLIFLFSIFVFLCLVTDYKQLK